MEVSEEISLKTIDIAANDLRLLLRDRKIFLFTLLMPAVFTVLFGFAQGGFSASVADSRLPVGFFDHDVSRMSQELKQQLEISDVVRLAAFGPDPGTLEGQVATEDLAAALIVPPGYGHYLMIGRPAPLELVIPQGSSSEMAIQSEALRIAIRMQGSVAAAAALEDAAGQPFNDSFKAALESWESPPVSVRVEKPALALEEDTPNEAMAHTSPGMMLQFAIAGLMITGILMVNERKSRCMQRLLAGSVRRVQILAGHFLSIYLLSLLQFTMLILYGQYLLGVRYLSQPAATALMALASAAWVAGLGLLVGVFAKNEDNAVVMSLVPMFVLVAIGGGWVPLDVIGGTFQVIGQVTPIGLGMVGFKSITLLGRGMEAVIYPALGSLGYALAFFLVAWAWFQHSEAD